jgi:hypothetical protein
MTRELTFLRPNGWPAVRDLLQQLWNLQFFLAES